MIILLSLFLVAALLFFVNHFSTRSAQAEAAAIERIAAFVACGRGNLRTLGRGIARWNFVYCLVFVSERTTEQALPALRSIVVHYNIEYYLIKRAKWSLWSSKRAYCLALLSRLPIGYRTERCIDAFLSDKSDLVRFYALLAILSIDPDRAVERLATLVGRISRRDVAEILSVVGRGCCPIPYTPLLHSSNYNLVLLGIYLVSRFGITESSEALVHLVSYGRRELRADALEALTILGVENIYNGKNIGGVV